MNFHYKNGELHCESVPLSTIARDAGTPVYVYSLDEIERRVRAYQTAFPGALIAYAYKANSNLAVLRHLAGLGAGADVVSGGELWRALRAGVPPDKIVFNGNGKTPVEIAYALDSRVLCINIDGAEDMEVVAEVAHAKGVAAPVAFRVNPDIDAQTHPHISTGLKESKFGVPMDEAVRLYQDASRVPWLHVTGVHCHIGSQISQAAPLQAAVQSLGKLVAQLRADGIALSLLNIGGGLAIAYRDEQPLTPHEWAEGVNEVLGQSLGLPLRGIQLVLEPGRSIVGPAGALVAQALYLKKSGAKNFLVIDAGMNALIRPPLYGAYHTVRPVRASVPEMVADVVGPICESADVLGRDREIPKLRRGDLVAFLDAGAYGFSMASRYNQQPLPAEVVVRGSEWWIATRRETWEQMAEREL